MQTNLDSWNLNLNWCLLRLFRQLDCRRSWFHVS